MTSNIREHWDAVVELRTELSKLPDGTVYLVSRSDRKKRVIEGRFFVCSPQVAALMLVQDTHRLATTEEIENWKSDQKTRGVVQTQIQAKRESKVVLDLAGVLEQIRMMQQPQAPAVTTAAAVAEPEAPKPALVPEIKSPRAAPVQMRPQAGHQAPD